MFFAAKINLILLLMYTLGLGGCFSFASGYGSINVYFSKLRPLAFGLSAMGGGLGSTVLPILSVSLIHQYGWRGIFYEYIQLIIR